MRFGNMRQSGNVEDRRGIGGRTLVGGGLGLGGLVLVVLYLVLGGNPQTLLNSGVISGGGGGGGQQGAPLVQGQDPAADNIARVLGDTEDVWTALFRQMGQTYDPPRLVLFSDGVDSACGTASSAVGPFYCPADSTVYIDLAFYEELSSRYQAAGDAAQAYVVAHEIGHHVQNLLGTSDQVQASRARMREADANALLVKLELQADFYAGVWVHHANKQRSVLESGDVEEALRAAAALGDDRLQMRSRGYVVPESFTHGTAEQRARWFRRGLETGDVRQGDTFAAE